MKVTGGQDDGFQFTILQLLHPSWQLDEGSTRALHIYASLNSIYLFSHFIVLKGQNMYLDICWNLENYLFISYSINFELRRKLDSVKSSQI